MNRDWTSVLLLRVYILGSVLASVAHCWICVSFLRVSQSHGTLSLAQDVFLLGLSLLEQPLWWQEQVLWADNPFSNKCGLSLLSFSRIQFSKARLLRGYRLPEELIESHVPCEILVAQLWLGFPHWTKPTGIAFIIDVHKSELSLALSQVGMAWFCYPINQVSENANALRSKWRSPTLKQDLWHWMLFCLGFLKNFLFTSSTYSVCFFVNQLSVLSFSTQVYALDLLNFPFLFCPPLPLVLGPLWLSRHYLQMSYMIHD